MYRKDKPSGKLVHWLYGDPKPVWSVTARLPVIVVLYPLTNRRRVLPRWNKSRNTDVSP